MHRGAIHLAVRVGYVHLRIADLERALGFCRDGLGFCVTAHAREADLEVLALEAGDYHPHIVLSAGTPDRFRARACGDSCQDGAGNPESASFTGLAQLAVKHGTGAYAMAHGSSVASFAEDAADRERMTLIGHING